jgi:hypothetical protein
MPTLRVWAALWPKANHIPFAAVTGRNDGITTKRENG